MSNRGSPSDQLCTLFTKLFFIYDVSTHTGFTNSEPMTPFICAGDLQAKGEHNCSRVKGDAPEANQNSSDVITGWEVLTFLNDTGM